MFSAEELARAEGGLRRPSGGTAGFQPTLAVDLSLSGKLPGPSRGAKLRAARGPHGGEGRSRKRRQVVSARHASDRDRCVERARRRGGRPVAHSAGRRSKRRGDDRRDAPTYGGAALGADVGWSARASAPVVNDSGGGRERRETNGGRSRHHDEGDAPGSAAGGAGGAGRYEDGNRCADGKVVFRMAKRGTLDVKAISGRRNLADRVSPITSPAKRPFWDGAEEDDAAAISGSNDSLLPSIASATSADSAAAVPGVHAGMEALLGPDGEIMAPNGYAAAQRAHDRSKRRNTSLSAKRRLEVSHSRCRALAMPSNHSAARTPWMSHHYSGRFGLCGGSTTGCRWTTCGGKRN